MAAVIRPRFYAWIALAITLIMVVGFSRTFYLRHWFDVPPISPLLILHGIVFTAWFAMFVVQTRLVAAGNVRLHRKVGAAGVVLAILVIVVTAISIVESANSPRPRPMGLNAQQFTFVPVVGIVGFAVCFAAAISLRRRADLHRRLMMLAMIFIMGPPVARILLVLGAQSKFLLAQTAISMALIGACLVYDWVKHRTVHPIYSIGGVILLVSWPLRFWVAATPQWEAVGRWMAGI